MRIRVLSLMLLVLTSLTFAVDPIKTVENGLKPAGKSVKMVFEKEVVFGADEDDDVYIWGGASTGMTVDQKGHFFIADIKNNQVHEFNPKGEFVATVVKQGQGPGEASNLTNYLKYNDGAIMLEAGFGLPKLTWFDEKGQTKTRQISMTEPFLQTMNVDPTGQYIYAMWVKLDQSSGMMVLKTGLLDIELNVLKELSSAERPAPTAETFSTPAKAAEQIGGNISTLMAKAGVATFDNDGHVYLAVSDTYEIVKYKLGEMDKPLLKITKDYKPYPMPEAEVDAIVDTVIESLNATPLAALSSSPSFRENAKKAAEPPQTMRAINGLVATEDGHLLVLRRLGFSIPTIEADVFDKNGKFIGTTSWDSYAAGTGFNSPMIFKNNKAYALLRDEMGEIRAARFNYKVTK